ncbi:MAG: SDR family oxidoreductase [Burkholderiales bacterium]|nr:SDR family oxidoreductase [Burkholderiales bacterium]
MANARNPFSLAGKAVLVTGASSGLGRSIAIACSRMGARVIVTGRDQARLADTFGQLAGDGHVQFVADLTQSAQMHALVDAAGTVDGVVHSVGLQRLAPIKLVSEKLLGEVIGTNFVAPVMLTQRLLYRNALAEGGAIVFLSSSAAHIGTPGVGPYSSMKAALHGLTRCLALEQAKRRVRVNCISPSAVETPLWDRDHLEAQRARHPLGLGTPDDVAAAAIYLLSDASRWVTGTTLIMDGGAM